MHHTTIIIIIAMQIPWVPLISTAERARSVLMGWVGLNYGYWINEEVLTEIAIPSTYSFEHLSLYIQKQF